MLLRINIAIWLLWMGLTYYFYTTKDLGMFKYSLVMMAVSIAGIALNRKAAK